MKTFLITGVSTGFGRAFAEAVIAAGHTVVGTVRKAAQALLDLVAMADPPMHLLLGSDALSLVRAKLNELTTNIDTYESVSTSTDGPT